MNRTIRSFCAAALAVSALALTAGCAAQTQGQKQAAAGWTPAKAGVSHSDFAKMMAAGEAKAMAARGYSPKAAMAKIGKPPPPATSTGAKGSIQ